MGLEERAFDEADHPGSVVEGCVFGQETVAGGWGVGVAEVCVDYGVWLGCGRWGVGGRGGGEDVLDYAYAEFVG